MSTVRLVEFIGHGGLFHYAFQLTRGLRDNGLDATLISARDHELRAIARHVEVKELFHTWDPWTAPTYTTKPILRMRRKAARIGRLGIEWLRLLRYLEREQPRWVQFGEMLSPLELPFLIWLKRRGFRLADVCHNTIPFDQRSTSSQVRKHGSIRQSIYNNIYKNFDLIFVHSRWSRSQFLQLYQVDPKRVALIPHGNEELFALQGGAPDPSRIRRKLNLADEKRVVLFFGILSKYKGVEDLICAFPTVIESIPDAHLVLAGYPRIDLGALRHLITQLNLENHVTLWPEYIPVEDVASLAGLAQVAVFPYRSVDQSGAIHVAYTFGLPVVATAVGGLHEVVEPGESGLVVPPNDGAALARALVEVLEDPSRAQNMGRYARRLSETRYSWREVGRQAAQWLT